MPKSFHLSSAMQKSLQDEKFLSSFQAPELQVKTASSEKQEIRTNVFSSLLSISKKLDELGLSKSAQQTLNLFSFAKQEAEKNINVDANQLFFTIAEEK